MLERARIRADALARLLAADTAAGEHVFASRVTPYLIKDLPALCVYTLSDRGTSGDAAQVPEFATITTLTVEARVAHEDGWDDALDSLCEEVEAALLEAGDFVGQFDRVAAFNTAVSFDDGGEHPLALAVMTFDLAYTMTYAPRVTDALEAVGLRVDVIDPAADPNISYPGPDGRIEAGADWNIQQ